VNYRESYGLHASSGILFNHESPRRGIEFVTRKVTHGSRASRPGWTPNSAWATSRPARLGLREDYVRAMWLMLQRETPEDFVVATGATHSVRELCDVAFRIAGLDYEEFVRTDQRFIRPAEVDLLVGDATKARDVLGWKCETDFYALIEMMVDADLKALQR